MRSPSHSVLPPAAASPTASPDRPRSTSSALTGPLSRCRSNRRSGRAWPAILLAFGLWPASAAGDSSTAPQPRPPGQADARPQSLKAQLNPQLFPVPPELRDNVTFWTKVYTEFDSNVRLLHDDLHLGVIYAALDFTQLNDSNLSMGQKQRRRKDEIRKAKEKYQSILSSLAAGRVSKTYPADQARVESMFVGVPGGRSKYSKAIDRLRTQTCLKNRFAEGIERSGYYMEHMENVFRRYDLPLELTRIPFVESLFQWGARSAAAAGGIWQFMPSTGRMYLSMRAEMDERFDPLRATEAAAKLLSTNHKSLKTWPLAITAYNHGRGGMKRAVRQVGTRDLGRIAQSYRSRTFGFASRNFYSEFVAAWQAYENRAIHFPDARPAPTLSFDEISPASFVHLPKLAHQAAVDLSLLKKLNPALSRAVWAGNLYFPKNYPLKVPAGSSDQVRQALNDLPSSSKSAHQVGLRYRVRSGDTLGAIARRYGTSVGALQRANRLRGHLIRVGQKLLIPPSSRAGSTPIANASTPTGSASRSSNPATHTVKRGENLSRIAAKYGTTVKTLRRMNGLRSANQLRVGQRLKLPRGGGQDSHLVQRGETLAKIAGRYGTSVEALRRANRLKGDVIHPGQVLVLP